MNRRPSGYEPDELPNCSTPRYCSLKYRDYYSTESSCCQEKISNFCAISHKNAICSTCNSIHACFFRTRCATLIAFFKMHSQPVSTGSREFGEFPTIEKTRFPKKVALFLEDVRTSALLAASINRGVTSFLHFWLATSFRCADILYFEDLAIGI